MHAPLPSPVLPLALQSGASPPAERPPIPASRTAAPVHRLPHTQARRSTLLERAVGRAAHSRRGDKRKSRLGIVSSTSHQPGYDDESRQTLLPRLLPVRQTSALHTELFAAPACHAL